MANKPVKLAIFGRDIEVLEDSPNQMDVIIKCPNCGQPTTVGNTRMICGFTGCDNKYLNGNCFKDDLMPRVLEARESTDQKLREKYINDGLYSIEMQKEIK